VDATNNMLPLVNNAHKSLIFFLSDYFDSRMNKFRPSIYFADFYLFVGFSDTELAILQIVYCFSSSLLENKNKNKYKPTSSMNSKPV
jgi:hypothetical protein